MYERGEPVTIRFPDGREIEGRLAGWELMEPYPESIQVMELAWPERSRLRQLRKDAQEARARLDEEIDRFRPTPAAPAAAARPRS